MLRSRRPVYFSMASVLVLVIITLAVYSRVRSYPFVNYDDDRYVTQNSHVTAGLSWNTFNWALTATYQSNWHPLTWLSHALDCELYGLNAGGAHVTSVLIHLLNAVILFLLLMRATGALGRSLMVSVLFAVHPLNVESVAWIAERKNVLSTFFFLLALAAYGWYAQKPGPDGAKRYILLVVVFVMGLACKPMVITLPFVLLLLDFWPLRRIQERRPIGPVAVSRRQKRVKQCTSKHLYERKETYFQTPLLPLILEKVPLLLFSAGSALITIIAQRSKAIRSLENFPFRIRLANALCSYTMYVWKAFWPTRLALFYPYPGWPIPLWQLSLAGLFLIGVSSLAWYQRFDRPYVLTGWLWYLGILVPVIGFVQIGDQAMADRYAYIPLIGMFVIVIWGTADWAERRQINFIWRTGLIISILGTLSFLTWRQVNYWRSSFDLWSHTLEVTQRNAIAEGNLGDALHSTGRVEEALPHFGNAVALQPRDPYARANLAEDLAQCGRLREAVAEYQTVSRLASDNHFLARTFISLAMLYGALEDYPRMRTSYRQALQVDPQLGPEVIASFSQSVAANPLGTGYLQLGILLQEAKQGVEARAAFEQALKLDPSLLDAIQSLDVRD
jgi:hypothetical protein